MAEKIKPKNCIISGERNPDLHQIGTSTFAQKYEKFRNWLLSNNWEYNELLNKWRHK